MPDAFPNCVSCATASAPGAASKARSQRPPSSLPLLAAADIIRIPSRMRAHRPLIIQHIRLLIVFVVSDLNANPPSACLRVEFSRHPPRIQ